MSYLSHPLYIAILLLGIYLLTYSGRFHGIDEIAAVVTVESLMRGEGLAVPQFEWAVDWKPTHVAVGEDGELYSKRGIGYSLAFLPFWALGQQVDGLGLGQVTALVNTLVTVVTALMLMRMARLLEASRRRVVEIGLLYGLASPAWVYARFHYSEPLITACWLAAFWCCKQVREQGLREIKEEGRERREAKEGNIRGGEGKKRKEEKGVAALAAREGRKWHWAFWCGLVIGIALLIHSANAVILLLLGAWWLSSAWKERTLSPLIGFGLGVLPSFLILATLNWLRFGSPLASSYTSPEERFIWDYVASLPALLVSPGKGIICFAPVTILTLWGWRGFWREARPLALLVLGWIGATLALYGGWFMWWGGWAWGARYLVPLLPLLLLPLVWYPETEKWGIPRVALLGAGIWGAIVNGLGAVVDFNVPLVQLGEQGISDRGAIWRWAEAPPLAHARLLWQGQHDLAWWQPSFDALIVLSIVLLMVIAFLLRKHLIAQLVCAALLLLSALIGISRHHWNATDSALLTLNRTLVSEVMPNDSVLVELVPYYDYFALIQAWINRYKAAAPYYTIVRGTSPAEKSLSEDGVLWLVLERSPPGDQASETEGYLLKKRALLDERWFDDYRVMRLLPLPEPTSPALHEFAGGITLSTALTYRDNLAIVALNWQSQSPIAKELKVFVQTIDSSGELIAQHDRIPHNGLSPTTTWQVNQPLQEGYALPATSDDTIIVGLYNPLTGERVPLVDGSSDFVTVKR